MPLVSIVTPLYNKEREVARAIQSVLNQSVENYELIVVNDGSTDKGPEIVRSILDPRIRMIEQPNAGVSTARNKGIAEASAELIAFLDADDEWLPDYLETILRLKDNFPDCCVLATGYFFRKMNGENKPATINGLPTTFSQGVLPDYFVIAAQSDPPIWSSAVVVKKSAIAAIGGFPEGVTAGEDLLTWARLAVNYKIAYEREPKAFFSVPEDILKHKPRIPQMPDRVDQGLRELLSIADERVSDNIRQYIGQWHKMRANIFLRLGRRGESLREVWKAMHYTGLNIKLASYAALAILPAGLQILRIVQSSRK